MTMKTCVPSTTLFVIGGSIFFPQAHSQSNVEIAWLRMHLINPEARRQRLDSTAWPDTKNRDLDNQTDHVCISKKFRRSFHDVSQSDADAARRRENEHQCSQRTSGKRTILHFWEIKPEAYQLVGPGKTHRHQNSTQSHRRRHSVVRTSIIADQN